jgi:hypothetical protein
MKYCRKVKSSTTNSPDILHQIFLSAARNVTMSIYLIALHAVTNRCNMNKTLTTWCVILLEKLPAQAVKIHVQKSSTQPYPTNILPY